MPYSFSFIISLVATPTSTRQEAHAARVHSVLPPGCCAECALPPSAHRRSAAVQAAAACVHRTQTAACRASLTARAAGSSSGCLHAPLPRMLWRRPPHAARPAHPRGAMCQVPHLEHLHRGHAEGEVCCVAQPQHHSEERRDGHDGAAAGQASRGVMRACTAHAACRRRCPCQGPWPMHAAWTQHGRSMCECPHVGHV